MTMTINDKKQNLVSRRLRDKRRKLRITLYAVPNDTNIHKDEIQPTETFSKTKTVSPKFYLIKNNNFI